MKFAIGDTVKLIANAACSRNEIGHIGQITEYLPDTLEYRVGLPNLGGNWSFEHDLELVSVGSPTMVAAETGSLRDNAGKVPFSEVPLEAMEAIATVLFKSSKEGGGKYPRRNWKKGNKHSVPMDSLLRHAAKRAGGQMNDPESGMPHSWHILINAVFLVFYEKHFPKLNDLNDEESK